ncbi:MAG: hypothetical protein V1899_09820, partial [Planctomycetota bacterium]
FIVVAAALAVLALWAMSFATPNELNWTTRDTALNLPGALMIYLQVALLPWTASFFHEMNRVISFGDWNFFGNLLTLAVIAGVCAYAARAGTRRLFFFGAIGWIAAIGPMLNISLWSFPAYDRYAYFGLAFLLLALALSIEGLLTRWQGIVISPVWLLLQRLFSRTAGVSPAYSDQCGDLYAKGRRDTCDTIARSKRDACGTSVVVLWAVSFVIVSVFGLWRGRLFANELAVARDAAIRSPTNCYGHAAVANTLIGDMNRAAREGRQINQKFCADTIALATRCAQQCWNFPEFFHSPAILLTAAAEVQLENDNWDEAENFSRAAIEEPRWSRFVKERDRARLILAEVTLRRADERIGRARDSQIPVADAERLANETLICVAAARDLFAQLQKLPRPELLNDTTCWIEFLAHRRLGEIGAVANRSQHLQLARQALEALPAQSLYHAQAEKELNALRLTIDNF